MATRDIAPAVGVLVTAALLVSGCSRENGPASGIDEILEVLESAGDSVAAWDLLMSEPEAAEKCVRWLRDRDVADSCGVSSDNAVWIEFPDGIGADIYPPWEIPARAVAQRTLKPIVGHNSNQEPRARQLLYDIVVFLPFHWQYPAEMAQDDSLAQVLGPLDPEVEVTSYRNNAAAVDELKYRLALRPSVLYICSHGCVSSKGSTFATGEEVTRTSAQKHEDDLKAGRLRLARLRRERKTYFGVTPAFIETYLFKEELTWNVASVAYVAACNSLGDNGQLAEAFLCPGLQAYCGFKGKVLLDPTVLSLLSEIWREMTDTVSLSRACADAPHRIQTHPTYRCTLKVLEEPFETEVIFDRLLFDLERAPLHSGISVAARRVLTGYQFGADMYDSELYYRGSFVGVVDAAEPGVYPIAADRANSLIFADSATGWLFTIDSSLIKPEWSGGQLGGTITLVTVDVPPGLVVGTFSGTLGYWDLISNPLPHPPDAVVEIEDGRFKVVDKLPPTRCP